MKAIAVLTLLTAFLIACGERTPPPPPPPHPANQEAAQQRAQALGVGPCEDIAKIKTLPFKGELGLDAQFDRMVVNFREYRSCLVGKITDETPMVDPSMGPKRHPYAVGNLAYDVITSSGFLDYEACIPSEISGRWEAIGAQALVEWTAIPGNRKKLQECVVAQLAAPNNSFKPNPLRGSA